MSELVKAEVFNERGTWKYTVKLLYCEGAGNHWDLWTEAREALRRATELEVSGVTFSELHEGWYMFVNKPFSKFSHPIVVSSTFDKSAKTRFKLPEPPLPPFHHRAAW
jgi:hypothetical protein